MFKRIVAVVSTTMLSALSESLIEHVYDRQRDQYADGQLLKTKPQSHQP